jgi:hypothetical protein
MNCFLMCLITILLSGCATTGNHCTHSATMTEPVYSKAHTYSDNDFSIRFNLEPTRIRYELDNSTNSVIRINWDEVLFINSTGISMRIMHGGVNYSDRYLSQIPSIIPPKTVSIDILIPPTNVFFDVNKSNISKSTKYVHFSSSQFGGWKELYLFPDNCDNCNFGLYFPLIINGKKKDLYFRFKLDECIDITETSESSISINRSRMNDQ